MAISTSVVFRPIKASDISYSQPFKAYKTYNVSPETFGAGYVTQSGVHANFRIDIADADTGEGVGTLAYCVNAGGTNELVAWKSLKHKYYTDGFGNLPEHGINSKTERNLFYSASTISLPYNDVGERIKPGTVYLTSSKGPVEMRDDGQGNLYNLSVATSSFASASFNLLHMSFNNEFKKFKKVKGDIGHDYVDYTITNHKQSAVAYNIGIEDGVVLDTGSVKIQSRDYYTAGLAAKLSGSVSYIRIPDDRKFDKMNKADEWTVSFWTKRIAPVIEGNIGLPIISKAGITPSMQFTTTDGASKTQMYDKVTELPNIASSSFNDIRTPFILGAETTGSVVRYHFHASDGGSELHITGSSVSPVNADDGGNDLSSWDHVLIRNSASLCEMFINGDNQQSTSGSIPNEPTINRSDWMIGSYYTASFDSMSKYGMDSPNANPCHLAELRMYDYAVNSTAITSLSDKNYLSGSLFQSPVVGNVFYRNGQIVVSSPMPVYDSGSGLFTDQYNLEWRGTHTIYENSAFVRVPKDIYNTPSNPSATYLTSERVGVGLSAEEQKHRPPGDRLKTMFTSGSVLPYITTIGLYNSEYQLLAVGKLAQPIQKRRDVDMNFVVRWDY